VLISRASQNLLTAVFRRYIYIYIYIYLYGRRVREIRGRGKGTGRGRERERGRERRERERGREREGEGENEGKRPIYVERAYEKRFTYLCVYMNIYVNICIQMYPYIHVYVYAERYVSDKSPFRDITTRHALSHTPDASVSTAARITRANLHTKTQNIQRFTSLCKTLI